MRNFDRKLNAKQAAYPIGRKTIKSGAVLRSHIFYGWRRMEISVPSLIMSTARNIEYYQ